MTSGGVLRSGSRPEQVLPAQTDHFGNAAAGPVVDTLHRTLAGIAKAAGDRSRAAEKFDQLGVGMKVAAHANSQPYVECLVNSLLIAADERSTDHSPMNGQSDFGSRLDEAVAELRLTTRTELAQRLTDSDNATQVAGQWVQRSRMPAKYRKPLEDLGISIDYLNDAAGRLRIAPRASQPVGLDVAKLAFLLEELEAALVEARQSLPPRTKARVVAALYADKEASAASSQENLRAMLRGIFVTREDESFEPTTSR